MNPEPTPQVPDYAREVYVPTVLEPVPLGTSGPTVGPDLVSRLLRRAETPGYDPELAYVLSVIAGWSYAHGQTLANKLKYYGLPISTVDEIRVRNPAMSVVASAFLIRSACGRIGVLSFRGTEPDDAINWLTDADVTWRAISGGKVHSGFYANLEALWDDICSCLARAIEPDPAGSPESNGQPRGGGDGGAAWHKPRAAMERLYVTGHSLGAAMAALAAARICADASPVPCHRLAGVYTFGQPAVGDAAFASQCEETFGKRLYRHVFANDVVPHLPPRSSGPFVHFGQERFTSSVHEPWAKPDNPVPQARLIVLTMAVSTVSWAVRRIDFVSRLEKVPFVGKYLLPFSIDDHSPARYIEASRSGIVGD